MRPLFLSAALAALSLAGPLVCALDAAETAPPPRADAAWGGEASLRAHREARQEATARREGGPTTAARSPGGSPSTAAPAGASSAASSRGPAAVTAPSSTPPGEPPNLAAIAAMRQAATQRQREEEKRIALERPLRVVWPSSPQASLSWQTKPVTVDGLDLSHSEVRTPRHTLFASALEDYYPVSKLEDNPRYGLVLAHRVRPDLRIECYTFPARSFLPDLEIRSVKAYQSCLQEVFEGGSIELLDPSKSFREFGPAILDLATRVVRFRHLPEPASSPEAPPSSPREFVDYLIPLPGELLVVRFAAPVALFESAQAEVENFLIELQLGNARMTTVAR